MIALRLVWLLSLSAVFIVSTSARAHDAPLALVEAVETHLRDCGKASSYKLNARLSGFYGYNKKDLNPSLQNWVVELEINSKAGVNLFERTVAGLEIIRVMAAPEKDGHINYICATTISDLPFMPDGRVLSALMGNAVDESSEERPSGYLNGSWLWNDLSETRQHSIARYTGGDASAEFKQEDLLSPGFYIITLNNEFADDDEKKRVESE